jgi:hypothetical protein
LTLGLQVSFASTGQSASLLCHGWILEHRASSTSTDGTPAVTAQTITATCAAARVRPRQHLAGSVSTTSCHPCRSSDAACPTHQWPVVAAARETAPPPTCTPCASPPYAGLGYRAATPNPGSGRPPRHRHRRQDLRASCCLTDPRQDLCRSGPILPSCIHTVA